MTFNEKLQQFKQNMLKQKCKILTNIQKLN
jgi:hypothetical protein